MNRPPKLLFFAYAFPPSRAIGAVRCWNIAKHLSRRGWDVEVVTPNPQQLTNPEPGRDVQVDCQRENIHLRETGCDWRLLMGGWLKLTWWQPRLLAKVARRATGSLGIDPTVGWINAAVKACDSLEPGDVDVVLASAPPYTAFEAAAIVARRIKAPLVLDYRDLWSQNPHYGKLASKKIRQREASLLAGAHGVTVVSPSMADCLKSEFKQTPPVTVITNGYDAEEYVEIVPERFDDFAVVYAGRFYPPRSNAMPLVAAIAAANKLNPPRPIWLHYYGADTMQVENIAAALGASAWVKIHGTVPRKMVLAALKGADVAAVITTIDETASVAEKGILTGKLFEAIGAKVPVLLISPEGSDAAWIMKKNKYGESFVGRNVIGMATWLKEMCVAGCQDKIGRNTEFSWVNIAAKLTATLRPSNPDKV